ncbi:hypothetical protein M434DRAFT_31043 [Hypoxylon sp. CO27-5]|nr:hypothetical protein M434DRAFT_31043 [Hypoxylon sp. CO27-5]
MASSPCPSSNGYSMLESTNIITSGAVPYSEMYDYESKYGDMRLPTIHEEISGHRDMGRRCFLDDGLVDDCSKSRFYARALEFYLLEDNPESSMGCRCLMENCPQRNFTNSKEMLRHLKDCPSFSQGLFRCPTCNDAEKFRTGSKRSCSWNREKFSQKVQRKLKDTIKSFTHHYSASKIPPPHHCAPSYLVSKPASPFEVCEKCGQLLRYELSNSSCPNSMRNSPCPTSPDTDRQEYCQELVGTKPQELHGESSSSSYKVTQLKQTYYDEASGLYHPVLNQSPSSNQSFELDSSPIFETCIHSTDVSPLSSAETGTTVPTGQTQSQCLTRNQYRRMEGIRSASDIEGIPNDGDDYIEQASASWVRPQSTLLYDAPTIYNPALPAPCSPLGLYGGRGCTLSIQTGHLGSNTDNLIWQNMALYHKSTMESLNAPGSPVIRSLVPSPSSETETPSRDFTPSPLSLMKSPTYPNLSSYMDPSAISEKRAVAQNIASVDNSPYTDSELPSSSSDQQLDSESSEHDMKCSFADCNFKPSGNRPENYKSYLRKHMATHQEQRHECGQCTKVFTRADNREVHRRKSHHVLNGTNKRRDSSNGMILENNRKKRVRVVR